MRVVGYHYNYIGDDADGNPVELWGNDHTAKRESGAWHSMCQYFVIENRNRLRSKKRDEDRKKYYADRDECGLEVMKSLSELQREGIAV
jgi:hypothetical protein